MLQHGLNFGKEALRQTMRSWRRSSTLRYIICLVLWTPTRTGRQDLEAFRLMDTGATLHGITKCGRCQLSLRCGRNLLSLASTTGMKEGTKQQAMHLNTTSKGYTFRIKLQVFALKDEALGKEPPNIANHNRKTHQQMVCVRL